MPLFGGGVVATLLATGPIVLTMLFVESSNRPEIPYQEAARGALHPANLLTAVVPDLYSVRSNLPYWGPASLGWPADWLSMNENMGQIYIGALPILLLLAAGILRGRLWAREIRFFTLTVIALIIYALGRYSVFFPFIYHYVPGVDLFRRPADATYMLGAMASIVSGYLLHRVLSDETLRASLRHLAIALVLALLFAVSLGVAAAHAHFYQALTPVLLSIGFFTAGWLVLVFAQGYAARYGALTIAAIAAFVTADLAVNNGPNRSTAKPPSEYEELRADTKNETLAFFKEHLGHPANSATRDRVEMVGLGFEWPNISLIHNFDHTLGYNPLRLEEAVESMGASETVADSYQREFTRLFPSYRSTMADMLGLRYIATDRPIEKIDKTLKPGDLTLAARTRNSYIYENPRALPRVLFVFDWQPANFDRMEKDGRWPFFDPRRTVLLQSPQMSTPQLRPVSLRETTPSLQIYSNTEVQIAVDAPHSGFIVLNDVWHPWWFGTVDGMPADVLRANVLFRAIEVPAGKHIVRFEFRPVEGALKEIEAHLTGKPIEPPAPIWDHRLRPVASARAPSKGAG